MSFATKLKRAFGFGSEEYDDEDYDTSLPTYAAGDVPEEEKPVSVAEMNVASPFATVDTSAVTARNDAPADPASAADAAPAETAAPAASDAADPSLPGDLFDALIALFNSFQPEFVAKCLSTEQQRRFIFDSLEERLRRRIEACGVPAAESVDAVAERSRMMEELVRLREDNKLVAELRDRMEQSNLSAERQKRALTNRVIDLQNKVDDLEAAYEKLRLEAAIGASRVQPEPSAPAPDPAETEKLKAEIERLTTINEQHETKARMSDAMINDLTAKAAEARKEVEQMHNDLKVVDEISSQLEKVEDAVNKKDARIAELTAELDSLNSRFETVRAERESMRKTIENNLYNQAHTESLLRKEIKKLEKKLADAGKAPKAEGMAPAKPRKRTITAIDENAGSTDWFDSTPPPGEGKLEAPENPDFGYQAPQRKKHNDNDAQMLLW